MFEAIISPLAIILSLCTTTGVLLHETKVDKVASLTFLSTMSARYVNERSLDTTPHTHVERTSLNHTSKEIRGSNPGLNPRRDDKKFRLQKRVSKGIHAFDSYHLPYGLPDNS